MVLSSTYWFLFMFLSDTACSFKTINQENGWCWCLNFLIEAAIFYMYQNKTGVFFFSSNKELPEAPGLKKLNLPDHPHRPSKHLSPCLWKISSKLFHSKGSARKGFLRQHIAQQGGKWTFNKAGKCFYLFKIISYWQSFLLESISLKSYNLHQMRPNR